jgi:hypothetical protein
LLPSRLVAGIVVFIARIEVSDPEFFNQKISDILGFKKTQSVECSASAVQFAA